jgi:exopolysaccharide biosynthesis WecB/TagA/CpsF family protein
MKSVFRRLVDAINIYPSSNEAICAIVSYLENNKKAVIAFANAHAFNMSRKNSFFFDNLINSSFLLRDGIGVKIYFRMLGLDPGYNLNGTDFIPELLAKISVQKSVAIFGTEVEVIDAAIDKVQSLGCTVVATAHGFHPLEFYLDMIKDCKVDIYILAMGMPKQEALASMLYERIDHGSIVCGGAIIDFIAGKVKRAPSFYRRFGLEWFYRLISEPRRMFVRYVVGNFAFLISALRSLR